MDDFWEGTKQLLFVIISSRLFMEIIRNVLIYLIMNWFISAWSNVNQLMLWSMVTSGPTTTSLGRMATSLASWLTGNSLPQVRQNAKARFLFVCANEVIQFRTFDAWQIRMLEKTGTTGHNSTFVKMVYTFALIFAWFKCSSWGSE